MTSRRPVKGYVKKQKDAPRPVPIQSAQEPTKNFLFAPQMQVRQHHPGPAPPQESMLLQRLEEMTRRIDLMQNSQKLSSTTQLLPDSQAGSIQTLEKKCRSKP